MLAVMERISEVDMIAAQNRALKLFDALATKTEAVIDKHGMESEVACKWQVRTDQAEAISNDIDRLCDYIRKLEGRC